ncbi:GNAT family N-acetyltransferase [Streptomyces violaceusniger]|uniref:GCN5-related N-acetyltransferase n=1 Tax=Streptomyces violaceusniger (strain Tu 4113) TaxID=653045 RepID=G2P9K1_STRV4|nr:GNAT family N-acetyltransferase [Streptomyces violaceusniger]AEM88321.1 GCN5-related N-acetyltransferase [Streptomyces violaceusniger Tu 4113]
MIITPAQPSELPKLIAFREEAASWLKELGTDQWSRPYPGDLLLASIETGTVFMVRDGDQTAATITLTPEAEDGLWTEAEMSEPSIFANKLTVARTHAGQNLGGRLLNWAGDRAYRASAKWLRLDAWTTNEELQCYYLRQGFEHVRTVHEGDAVNGGPRVSGWLAQRLTRSTDHGFVDETPAPEPVPLAR